VKLKTPALPNPKAEVRQLQYEWEEMLKRQSVPLSRGAKARGIKVSIWKPEIKAPVPENRIPSLTTIGGSTALPKPKVYTGTKIIGIATMHKSNMIPIFNEEAAVDVARMRRN
jgi:hypothetical protein